MPGPVYPPFPGTERELSGPEGMTQALHAREKTFISLPHINPDTQKPYRSTAHTLAPTPHQESMFSSGVPDLPYHAMSPRQFAASPGVWWHGRYGEDLPSDSYKEDYEAHVDTGGSDENYKPPSWGDEEDEEDDSKEGHYGIHFGTRAAAIDRLRSIGPGRIQSEDQSHDEELPYVGDEPRVPGRLFPVTLNNQAMEKGIQHDVGTDWRPHMGYDEPAERGVYYKNQAEDRNSVSAAVPTKQTSVRSMSNRNGNFFNSWNDHVLDADPDTVHPLMRWAAERMPEHTGEDWIHPSDQALMARRENNEPDPVFKLFEAYGGVGTRVGLPKATTGESIGARPASYTSYTGDPMETLRAGARR